MAKRGVRVMIAEGANALGVAELTIGLVFSALRSIPLADAGIKAGQKLQKEEMQALIDGLFACSTSNYSPDGLPTFFIFDLRKIESYFSRQ